MVQVELACPFCAGRFQAEAATVSRATSCPNCGRLVTVPAVQITPPPPPTEPMSESKAPAVPRSPFDLTEPTKTIVNRRGEAVPLRRLSPGARERYRRRLNLAFAAIGMVLLAIALAVLLRLRP